MRILWLGLSNSEHARNYYPALQKHLVAVTSTDTEVVVRGTKVGELDTHRYFEFLDTASLLTHVPDAAERGFDAIGIGNVLDPGLREARSISDVPVLGLGETSHLWACMMGDRFSLVAPHTLFLPRLRENLRRSALEDRVTSLEAMTLTPSDLDKCFTEPENGAAALIDFERSAQRALEKGAEVIVPAGGRLVSFLRQAGCTGVGGAPILDTVAALALTLETAVRLTDATGGLASRLGTYSRPADGQLQDALELYRRGYGGLRGEAP